MDEQVQMVVHDAPGPDLDPAERGHGSDPLHDPILYFLGFEQHRPIRDARGDVIATHRGKLFHRMIQQALTTRPKPIKEFYA